MKNELTVQDVYKALKMALYDVGVSETDANEYLENNFFIKRLFVNLEKIQGDKKDVFIGQ